MSEVVVIEHITARCKRRVGAKRISHAPAGVVRDDVRLLVVSDTLYVK